MATWKNKDRYSKASGRGVNNTTGVALNQKTRVRVGKGIPDSYRRSGAELLWGKRITVPVYELLLSTDVKQLNLVTP